MASKDNSGPAGTKEFKREPSPTGTPLLSASDGLGQLANTTSPGSPGQGGGAPCDAAIQEQEEEWNVQPDSASHRTEPDCPVSNESANNDRDFLPLYFPQKLWQIVESDEFQSIWWSNGGKCVAVNEELFKQEVLNKKGPMRVFDMQTMRSFCQQMSNYGFTRIQQNGKSSASLPDFLAEEGASTHSKILHYYNPNFNREQPHLLRNCKRRVGTKQKATTAPKMDEGQPPNPQDQPAEDEQAPLPGMTAPTNQQAEASPGLGSAAPSPGEAAAVLPEPAGAAGRQKATFLNLYFLQLQHSQSPNGRNSTVRTIPLLGLPIIAAAPALPNPTPHQRQSPAVTHCLTCNCSLNSGAAGDTGAEAQGRL